MKISKKHILYATAILMLIAAFVLDRVTRKVDIEEIQEVGVLRIATDYNSVNYFIEGDSVRGFQYELINVMCDSLGLKPEWVVENNLDKNIEDLNAGRIDIVARNIPVTTELREKVAFSLPIVNTQQVLIQRKAKYNNKVRPIRNQIFLAKKKIYVPENSPSILRLKNLESEIADTIFIKEMPNYESEQLMMMVAKADIDFAVCDIQTAKINASLMPEIDIKTAISFMQMQSWAMRHSSFGFQAKVDSFLIHFLKTKAYRDIYRKYYK